MWPGVTGLSGRIASAGIVVAIHEQMTSAVSHPAAIWQNGQPL
jgi:hypothetical protein